MKLVFIKIYLFWQDLLRKHDCASVCPECELVKIARSKHCEICGKCVSVYDHHCPWINNCVGAR